MQIYLLKDLAGKGKAGEIINVNDGYGKNFIIKNGIGRAVDSATLAQVKAKQESQAFKKAEEITAIKADIAKLAETKVSLTVRLGENNKFFGSITAQEIVGAVNKQGFNLDKKTLVFVPIKELGEYKIKVKFPYNLNGEFCLEVKGGS